MKQFKLTKVYETYYDAYIEAESLEEAIRISKDEDTEWEEDFDKILNRTTWAELDENGDTIEDGVVEAL